MCAQGHEAVVSTPEVVARALGVQPLYRVESPSGDGLAVAKWRFASFPSHRDEYPESILICRAAGSACTTKTCEGRTIAKRPKIGSVTFCPGDGRATWTLHGAVEAMHVYLRRDHLARFAEDCLGGASPPQIDDFFAIEDPWLDGYFRMLTTELESYYGPERPAECLLLDQTEQLLLRHLVRWHSDARPGGIHDLDLQAKVNPLRPALVRRVEEYVDANLSRDITLADLANLSCMSIDHFLRSFRAARGTTPYRYVLGERMRRASMLLRTTATPIGEIATECGFRNLSHFSVKFHAEFGVSPSRFRRLT